MIAEIQSHPVLPLRTQEGLVLKRVLWYNKQPLMIVRVNSKESISVGGFAQEPTAKPAKGMNRIQESKDFANLVLSLKS